MNHEYPSKTAFLSLLCMVVIVFPVKTLCDEPVQDPKGQDDGTDFSQLKKELDQQKEKISNLEKHDADKKQTIEALQTELADVRSEVEISTEMAMEDSVDSGKKLLSIYGFFDLSFIKFFTDEHHPYKYILMTPSSFVITNLNLYIASQMTETLSTLLELRFTFLPNGSEVSPAINGISEYERTYTGVIDYHNSEEFVLGGVKIERIQMTYSPTDWFNISAGRYISPFGIWNANHGSPVILTISMPYMQIREMMPRAQTGIYLFGRFFPHENIFLDYAVTLSNGRGAMEEVFDLDENKAVGLRLKLTFKWNEVKVAIGGYGYYGKATDIEKELELMTDENLFWETNVIDVESYHEIGGAADLLIEMFGLTFQSEYIRQYIIYDKTSPLDDESTIFFAPADGYTRYYANSVGQAIYGLIGYELPLDELIAPVRITPFFMYEYCEYLDTINFPNMKVLTTGINVKPSPFVVLKAEYLHITPFDERMGEPIQSVKAQMAVSF